MTTVRHDIVIPQTTVGLSPKLIVPAIVGLVGYVLTKLAIPFDPALEQAANILSMVVAAYLAPPGAHPVETVGVANDDLLPSDFEEKH